MNYEPLYTFAEKHRVPYNELCTALRAALAAPMPEPSDMVMVPREPTREMIAAYLAANTQYWKEVDELPRTPTTKWRQGTPSDATRESYRAMIAAAPPAAPADSQPCTTKPVVGQKAANLMDNADMVMVPREPTQEHFCRAVRVSKFLPTLDQERYEDWAAEYRAMIAAAPPAAPAVPLTDGMVAHLEQQAFASTNYSPERPLYQHWFRVGVRAGYGIAAAPAPVVQCPTCNGDDMQAPCAYPEGGQPGCLRDKRLSAAPPAAPAVPLTIQQYNMIPELCAIKPSLYESIVRAIEKAHGIGGGNG